MENNTNETTISAIRSIKTDLDNVISTTDIARDSLDGVMDTLAEIGLLTEDIERTLTATKDSLGEVLDISKAQLGVITALVG